MHPLVQEVQQKYLNPKAIHLRPGDTVRVHVRVVEGNRERIQPFEGVVMRVRKGGLETDFTVRRVTHGVGVERTFLLHSPRLDRIEILRHGEVRRAQLYYLRERVGKRARIKELRASRARVHAAPAAEAMPSAEEAPLPEATPDAESAAADVAESSGAEASEA